MYLKHFFQIAMLVTGLASASCQESPLIQIVPQPQSVFLRPGRFTLNAETRIYIPEGKADFETVAQYFKGMVQASSKLNLPAQPYRNKVVDFKTNSIYFLLDETVADNEGYELDVRTTQVVIRARSAAGAFYGVQTLLQLLPPKVYSRNVENKIIWAMPCCIITDAPRFQYRGMHLDVGRHFFSVAFIKKYIDLLALHKINTFHWHLTEDQGWRIEIKKYPKLQSIAACRDSTLSGHYTDVPVKYDGKKYCGYYTQEEVKELVEYARKRFVTIIPEIEMPGHARAALAAYPELGCTGGPYQTATTWGVHEDVFCAGNEQTFAFLQDVLDEVCALFPGQYVHVGGDECPKTRWESCPKCQKRKQQEGLKDEHELQSYFIRRAEKMLAKHNKKLIGWDEILEGGLAPTATVMSWRGIDGGIAAAKAHHDVIMTPTTYFYFDYYQGDPNSEPVAIGGYLPLESVYGYEPLPTELTPEEQKYILGVQANVWTEYINNSAYLEYMAFPRACALAEIAWSAPERKDYKGFVRRLQTHLTRLDALNVNYAKSVYDLRSSFSGGKVALSSIDSTLQIRYTVNGTDPTDQSTLYKIPLSLSKTTTIKAAAFRHSQRVGNVHTATYLIHKATGKPYTMSVQPEKYNGGETNALTNGITGGTKSYKNWVGLVNTDIDPVIDLGASTPINRVSTNFGCMANAYIYPPIRIEVFISDDGKKFKSLAKKSIDADSLLSTPGVQTVSFDTPGGQGRYLKVVATAYGPIGEGQRGAGNGTWTFIDEIIVE